MLPQLVFENRAAQDLCNPSNLPVCKHKTSPSSWYRSSMLNVEAFGGNSRMHNHGEENHTIIHQERNEARLWIICPSSERSPDHFHFACQSDLTREGLESARGQSTGRVPSIHSVFVILLAEPG